MWVMRLVSCLLGRNWGLRLVVVVLSSFLLLDRDGVEIREAVHDVV